MGTWPRSQRATNTWLGMVIATLPNVSCYTHSTSVMEWKCKRRNSRDYCVFPRIDFGVPPPHTQKLSPKSILGKISSSFQMSLVSRVWIALGKYFKNSHRQNLGMAKIGLNPPIRLFTLFWAILSSFTIFTSFTISFLWLFSLFWLFHFFGYFHFFDYFNLFDYSHFFDYFHFFD